VAEGDEATRHGARRPAGRRRSLRRRLALWMLFSTLFTLTAFAAIAYVQLVLEARDVHSDEQGEPNGPVEDASEQMVGAMLLAAPLCLALCVGGALWLSRRALAPLTAVIADAKAMTVDDLKRRLPVPERNDELQDLTLALNGLLARLQDGFQSLGNYASAASHELRTPLAVIASELEVALRRPRSPEEWQRVAATSLDEVRRLTKLVEALLELARATAPHGEAQETLELGELVEQALAAVVAPAHDIGIRLETPTASSPIWVYARSTLLLNAIRELLRNALRYSPTASVVRVSIESTDPQGVAVHVDDCGPGVPASERTAIFEAFVRGPQAPAADQKLLAAQSCLGLGLAIVKRSMESCGGSVDIEAAPSGGARFTLRLRVAPPP
jgi:two-component system OmpR family sensor kinase